MGCGKFPHEFDVIIADVYKSGRDGVAFVGNAFNSSLQNLAFVYFQLHNIHTFLVK
jgi:hypothetical protein